METRSFRILAVSVGSNHDGEPTRFFDPKYSLCTLISHRRGHFLVQETKIGGLRVKYQELQLVMENQETGWDKWDTRDRGEKRWGVHSLRCGGNPYDTFAGLIEVVTDDGFVFVIDVLPPGVAKGKKSGNLAFLDRRVREAMERKPNADLQALQDRVGSKKMPYGLD